MRRISKKYFFNSKWDHFLFLSISHFEGLQVERSAVSIRLIRRIKMKIFITVNKIKEKRTKQKKRKRNRNKKIRFFEAKLKRFYDLKYKMFNRRLLKIKLYLERRRRISIRRISIKYLINSKWNHFLFHSFLENVKLVKFC